MTTWEKKRSIKMIRVQKKAMDTVAVSAMPKEIIHSRLHVKTQRRFKCMSKDWNDFIPDEYFNGNMPTSFICSNKSCNCAAKHGFCVANKFLYTLEKQFSRKANKFLYDCIIAYEYGYPNGHVPLIQVPSAWDDSLYARQFEGMKFGPIQFVTSNVWILKIRTSGQRSNNYINKAVVLKQDSSKVGTWQESIMRPKYLFKMKSHHVSKVIGGVFQWHEFPSNRIIAYDSGKMTRQFEGTKDGSLQLINVKDMVLDVWILKSSSSYMDEDLVCKSKWSLVSSASLWDIGVDDIYLK